MTEKLKDKSYNYGRAISGLKKHMTNTPQHPSSK